MGATEIIEDLTGVLTIETLIEGPAGPAYLSTNINNALTGANAPSAANVFSTANDLSAHVSAHPSPTNRDTRNEAAGVALALDNQHLADFAHGDIAHANRANLNAINQDLATTSSPSFAAGTVGDVAGGDYSEFEADGTLVFKGGATVWRDIDFPVVLRNAVAGQPSPATLQGNLKAPQWAVNDFFDCQGQELVHEWKEGSTVYWHIHVYQVPDATDKYLKFTVEYTWANVSPTGEAVPANATITSPELLIPGGAGLKFYIFSIGSFTPTGGRIAGHVKPQLKRIAATGAAPLTNPFCEMLQLHVECDTSGSRAMTTK